MWRHPRGYATDSYVLDDCVTLLVRHNTNTLILKIDKRRQPTLTEATTDVER